MREIKLENFKTTEALPVTLRVRKLQSGESVASATITHTPPSGSAATIEKTIASPYVYMVFGPFAATGDHSVTVLATGNASTPSKSVTIFYFKVV